MSEEPDVNKMAAEFVSQNIERFYSTGKDVLKGAADKVRLHLDRSYSDYLACITERHSKAKSFFIRNEPTNLYSFYVPIGISNNKTKISNVSISAISAVNPFTVITGSGGSGKSVLMRHLLLEAIVEKEKVPIFLELRELNQTPQSLLEFINETLHSNRFTLDDEYIEKALNAGHFALLFDGFDEVELSIRKDIRKQLFQLTKKYDKNIILVSSRPDNEFSGWSAFSVFDTDALTLKQAVELVEKLPFDSDLRTKFLNDLRGGLFKKHISFLSNPLLLSIMLLTYGESAEIPNKLSIFYSQAYETLFQRHDALKAGFQRERLTKLDIQDFARVFSALSIQTYDKRIFSMPRTEALEYLEQAKNITGIEFNSNNYLTDAEKAVCLLIEDGLLSTFSHRSFQEYFAARFINSSTPDIQQKLIRKYSANLDRDSIMQLLFEMNPNLVERTFIIPYIDELERIIGFKKKVGYIQYLRFLKAVISEFGISDYGVDTVHERALLKPSFISFYSFISGNCKYLFEPYSKSEKESIDVKNYVRKEGRGNYLSIKISKLKVKDEILHVLAVSAPFASKYELESALNIKKALVDKHKMLVQSLNDILGN